MFCFYSLLDLFTYPLVVVLQGRINHQFEVKGMRVPEKSEYFGEGDTVFQVQHVMTYRHKNGGGLPVVIVHQIGHDEDMTTLVQDLSKRI